MGIKKNYLNNVVETIKHIDPSLKKDDIEKVVAKILKQKLKDPTIIMDNNVTGDGATITLTELCNWIDKRNPVISGNATFYMQPKEMMSPTSFMLRSLKKGRKAVKKEMFKYLPQSDEYQMLDLDQGNKKVIMNAEYGGSGAPTAAFYTKYSPAATTLMAQSIITTMAAFFEGYVGDNQKYFNLNECIDWMNIVINKKEKIPNWISVPNSKEVSDRIKLHFYEADASVFPIIDEYVNNCNDDQLIYLYYANNMKELVKRNPKIALLIRRILTSLPLLEATADTIPDQYKDKYPWSPDGKHILDYNKWVSKEMFLDPYNIPEVISNDMEKLISIFAQFLYVEYIVPDSIIKLNNHYRNTVLLVDTDSNVINADLFVSFILNEVCPGESFGRRKLYNEMILVNVLASCLDHCVIKILDFYGRCHNMDEDSRAELTMKNEFMFKRFFLMKVKKRYAASIALREGNIMIPFKLEIKGMDFIKAGVTDDIANKFTSMLEKYILFSDELELHEMMRELKYFEKEIYHDLKKGGTRFLKPHMYKAKEAYKQLKDDSGRVIGSQAWSLPVFRASTVWNELYPDRKIYSLDRVKIIKLTITGLQDLEKIKDKYPEEYNLALNRIFKNEDPNIQKSGLKVIALPSTVKEIPEWIIPFIDYDLIISDVISSFQSVIDSLKIEGIGFKTANGKANLTSCLIAI